VGDFMTQPYRNKDECETILWEKLGSLPEIDRQSVGSRSEMIANDNVSENRFI
jgi:hypothetical protein